MDDCIECPGYKDESGYGHVRHKGKERGAHRVAYCTHHGIEIESIQGMIVRHACDNPACVNPKHLSIGTHADNVRDKVERGRQARNAGTKNGQAKLTEEQVDEIRSTYILKSKEFGSRALAQKFGVSKITIQNIVSGRRWSGYVSALTAPQPDGAQQP